MNYLRGSGGSQGFKGGRASDSLRGVFDSYHIGKILPFNSSTRHQFVMRVRPVETVQL